MSELTTYRVIGIHPNGDRIEVSGGNTASRAYEILRMLVDSGAFNRVVIEDDCDPRATIQDDKPAAI